MVYVIHDSYLLQSFNRFYPAVLDPMGAIIVRCIVTVLGERGH